MEQPSENTALLDWHDLPVRQIPEATSLTVGEAWTIAFTYFTVAITVSLVHSTAGTPAWVIVAATLLVNSATATLAYAAVTAAGGSAVAGVVGGCLTASRFGVLAAALAPRLWPQRWKRAVAAFAAFDPNIALADRERKDSDARRVYIAMSLWLVLPWWLGASIGVVIGDWISDPKALGMDAMFPALFVALIRPQLTTNNARLIAVSGACVALALVEVLQGGLPVLVAALPALLALRSRENGAT
ncbi:MAG: AzlC family ABC transporter permease [Actinomycetota bacterium]|jgi:predicted branched-subunit amino acid permease|nr:AzlC family ABC transporter permease [Actinomycetota bacterium]MED5361015.1 AzlC family ABC transporter permease [Actinomycetota bacterium]